MHGLLRIQVHNVLQINAVNCFVCIVFVEDTTGQLTTADTSLFVDDFNSLMQTVTELQNTVQTLQGSVDEIGALKQNVTGLQSTVETLKGTVENNPPAGEYKLINAVLYLITCTSQALSAQQQT